MSASLHTPAPQVAFLPPQLSTSIALVMHSSSPEAHSSLSFLKTFQTVNSFPARGLPTHPYETEAPISEEAKDHFA